MQVTTLKIRQYPDLVLRKKSVPVDDVGLAEKLLIQAMIQTMAEHKGIGLAAPQVGINKRILVADIGDGPMAVINPQIIRRSATMSKQEEGCLSIPGVTVDVRRPKKIFVKYLNENNQKIEKDFDGLLARVILHETDHLNGKLIIDYVSVFKRRKLLEQIKNRSEKKEEFNGSYPAK